MKILNKLSRISSAAIRLTIGIGGAVLVYFAVKDNVKRRVPQKSQKTAKEKMLAKIENK